MIHSLYTFVQFCAGRHPFFIPLPSVPSPPHPSASARSRSFALCAAGQLFFNKRLDLLSKVISCAAVNTPVAPLNEQGTHQAQDPLQRVAGD